MTPFLKDKQIRRGIQTIEVIAAFLATVGTWIASAAQVVPPDQAVRVTEVAVVSIALARGLAKVCNSITNLTNEGWESYLAHIVHLEIIGAPKENSPNVVMVHPSADGESVVTVPKTE